MSNIDELEKQIIDARLHYYNGEHSVMSDEQFDYLVEKLKMLKPDSIAITMIGAPLLENSEWPKAKHEIPLGSLNKLNTPQEMDNWICGLFKSNNSICFSDKIDGLSIELIYKDGKLIQAITRGQDGLIGEDITPNVIRMSGVKRELPISFTGSLRGEILLKISNHKKFFQEYANPRNAASGIARRLDGAGCEHLDILFYQAIGDIDFDSEFLQLKFIQDTLGLNTPNYEAFTSSSVDNLVKFVVDKWQQYQDTIRDSLDWCIDGLVVSINDMRYQTSLGETHLRPKGKIAFKFTNQFAATKVKAIVWETGNSGRITPVCWFDKTNLLGSNIEKASVYNIAYIEKLGLGIGAEILVCKANEVIPRVERVIKPAEMLAVIPSVCPSCFGEVELCGEHLICVNTDTCPAQVVGRIKNWINSINILEWGDTLIERLVETGMVENITDIYKLSVEDLMTMERMGERSAKKCHSILWSHDQLPLEIFLGSLSIPMVANTTIKKVMDAGFDTLDKILSAKVEDIEKVKGMGPRKSASLIAGLKRNKDVIDGLLKAGLSVKKLTTGNLTGKSFCFTGTMLNKRKVLEDLVVKNGGQNKSVGRELSYLVIDDVNSGTSKATAAKKLGTKLISEDEFLKMCE